MILALHGFTGSPELWQGYSCEALPILGHGPTCIASGGENFSGEVDRLVGQIPPGTHHLVGYSLGARLALALAVRCPNRLEKLTLVGGSPGIECAQERGRRRHADTAWIDTLREKGIEAFVNAWQALPMWASQKSLPKQVLNHQRKGRLAHDPKQLALALHSLGTGVMPPMWDELSEIKTPVHIVVGELDEKYTAIARSMMSRLGNATLSIIEDAGHNPILEKPAITATATGLQYSP